MNTSVTNTSSCAVAETGSSRPPIAETKVRSRIKLCGISGGQSDTGSTFLPELRLPLPPNHSTNYYTIMMTLYHPGVVQQVNK
jgi:hypothetical protein